MSHPSAPTILTTKDQDASEVRDSISPQYDRHWNSAARHGALKVESRSQPDIQVGLLTAGRDKPYALGLASALVAQGIFLDFIGSEAVDGPELHATPLVNFLNLRDQREHVSLGRKILRVLAYYGQLLRYAAVARPAILHILWNNKFELIDRTLLMLYYKLLGKGIVFTAHNVNAGKRDSNDSFLNRLSLRVQYRLSDHLFVHTEQMKTELMTEFRVPESKVSVIPFGINNTVPKTTLTAVKAKQQLGISPGDKTMLFFGNIVPYKGLDCMIAALAEVTRKSGDYRLIIAGKPKAGCEDYWNQLQQEIVRSGLRDQVIERIQYIPDEETEVYFKAADVLVLPYTHVFQSGVLFLSYGFGLPVIASDVGSLRQEIIENETGLVFKPQDSADLAKSIETYFSSDLYRQLENRRQGIQDLANERYSWTKVGEITKSVYASLLADKQ